MSALDAMSEADARDALTRCCGATRWVDRMLARRPFGGDVVEAAREVWAAMERPDILEAFEHHPRIGADLDALRAKFADTASLAASEQAGALTASEETLTRLRDANVAYEARYGHIFIVCASGKSAREMLEVLEARMNHDPDEELAIAAREQLAITELRLGALERTEDRR